MEQKYLLNMHRMMKIRDGHLIITEQGSWAYLTKNDRRKLLLNRMDDKLFSIMQERGIILNLYNVEKVVKQEEGKRKFMEFAPSLHIILPTIRCNHQCIYCHSSSRADCSPDSDMDIKTARKTIDFIMSSPSKHIKIEYQGGDALLNKEVLKEIFVYGSKKAKEKRKKAQFSLVTNMTLLDDKMIDWLSQRKINITTSIDGPKEVHDANRKYVGGQGTYDDVIRKMKLCRNKGINVGALMVTTKHSLKKAKDIVDEYIKLGLGSIQLKYMDKIGFAQEAWKDIGYTGEEYFDFWKEAMEYIIYINKQTAREGKIFKERITTLMLKKILTAKDPGFLDLRNPCGIATGQIAYNFNGDIYSCDEGRGFDLFRLGNVKETTWDDYINNPNVHKLVESSVLETSYCDSCVYKPYCGQCPVQNYAEQKNLIPKVAVSYRCKILKKQFEWVFDKILFDKEARDILSSWIKK